MKLDPCLPEGTPALVAVIPENKWACVFGKGRPSAKTPVGVYARGNCIDASRSSMSVKTCVGGLGPHT